MKQILAIAFFVFVVLLAEFSLANACTIDDAHMDGNLGVMQGTVLEYLEGPGRADVILAKATFKEKGGLFPAVAFDRVCVQLTQYISLEKLVNGKKILSNNLPRKDLITVGSKVELTVTEFDSSANSALQLRPSERLNGPSCWTSGLLLLDQKTQTKQEKVIMLGQNCE